MAIMFLGSEDAIHLHEELMTARLSTGRTTETGNKVRIMRLACCRAGSSFSFLFLFSFPCELAGSEAAERLEDISSA